MATRQPRRSDQEWFDLIMECRQSGLSDKAWCEEHGIPTSMMILTTPGQDSLNTRTRFLQYPERILETCGQDSCNTRTGFLKHADKILVTSGQKLASYTASS